jgi:hypothetical protein
MTEINPIFNIPRGTTYITAQQLAIYANSFVYYVLLIRILNLSQIKEDPLLDVAALCSLPELNSPFAASATD